MKLVDIEPYKGKVIASHCYSGVTKIIRIDDVPTVDVNNLIIAEFEKLKEEINDGYPTLGGVNRIINNRISELKGKERGMNEEEYELWFDKDLKRDDFLEAESEE